MSTWKSTPLNGNFDDPANWEGGSPTDTATFGASSIPNVSFGTTGNTLTTLAFEAGAPSYDLVFGPGAATPALTLTGGITNGSGVRQYITVAAEPGVNEAPQLAFASGAVAGDDTVRFYVGPPDLQTGSAGGIITFEGTASAGTAGFDVRTGKVLPTSGPVGAEVRFLATSTAAGASFTVYGTLATTGQDFGDTFGNVVFNASSTAANATFLNIGGTVTGGDGGNTQFYDTSTAGNAAFHNRGGTASGANGGDVAFDGSATAGFGVFHNEAAPAEGGYGGVTSFNNNPPQVTGVPGANAGHAVFINDGARGTMKGGGGHTELTAKYGAASAGSATFVNFGSEQSTSSCAGHTYLTRDADKATGPTAGSATFFNHPSPTAEGVPGYTELAVWSSPSPVAGPAPTGANATFHNLGGEVYGASGGKTTFSTGSTAGSARLIAYSGKNGGWGGEIVFRGDALGDAATVELHEGGMLSVSYASGPLAFGPLHVNGGRLQVQVGTVTTTLKPVVLEMGDRGMTFSFYAGAGFAKGVQYTLLEVPGGLNPEVVNSVRGEPLEGVTPAFSVVNGALVVVFPA